jgi:hypothetical protein
MPREELIIGLKNAVSRGQSLESAIQSFISAGYNANEVMEAAQATNMGSNISDQIEQQVSPPVINSTEESQPIQQTPPAQNQNPQQQVYQKLPTMNNIPEHKHRGLKIALIFLFIILFLLLGGLVFMMFYGEKILNAMFG